MKLRPTIYKQDDAGGGTWETDHERILSTKRKDILVVDLIRVTVLPKHGDWVICRQCDFEMTRILDEKSAEWKKKRAVDLIDEWITKKGINSTDLEDEFKSP